MVTWDEINNPAIDFPPLDSRYEPPYEIIMAHGDWTSKFYSLANDIAIEAGIFA